MKSKVYLKIFLSILIFEILQCQSNLYKQQVSGETNILTDSNFFEKNQNSKIDYKRFYIVTGGIAVTALAIQIYQYHSWWKEWRRPFHFQEDLVYGKSVDKVGHAWGAAFSAFVISRSYEWSGIDRKKSLWIGAIGGSLFQLLVEFQDGYSQWGFDRVDAACDIVGGFYPLIQHHIPFFQNFDIKASYSPRKLGKPGGIPGQKHTIIDDYEGQTFWLSIKINQLYPDKLKFLDFLNLAIGYSVRNTQNIQNQYGVWLLALDLDIRRILPQSSTILRNISDGLNYFKFPTPALQISPKIIWFGLYF